MVTSSELFLALNIKNFKGEKTFHSPFSHHALKFFLKILILIKYILRKLSLKQEC